MDRSTIIFPARRPGHFISFCSLESYPLAEPASLGAATLKASVRVRAPARTHTHAHMARPGSQPRVCSYKDAWAGGIFAIQPSWCAVSPSRSTSQSLVPPYTCREKEERKKRERREGKKRERKERKKQAQRWGWARECRRYCTGPRTWGLTVTPLPTDSA